MPDISVSRNDLEILIKGCELYYLSNKSLHFDDNYIRQFKQVADKYKEKLK